MSFISTAAHKKFTTQCDRLVVGTLQNNQVTADKETKDILKRDLAKLHKLAEDYLDKISELSKLTNEYNNLQKHIRISIRKIQVANKQVQ